MNTPNLKIRFNLARLSLLLFLVAGICQAQTNPSGIQYVCGAQQIKDLRVEIKQYFDQVGISPSTYQIVESADGQTLRYVLNTPDSDTSTIYFKWHPEFDIQSEVVELPGPKGNHSIDTVSKKEILLALMQHGRLTQLNGKACDIQALKDHVGIRQMIVAWSQKLDWSFPDGDPANWNPEYWHAGDPKKGIPLLTAMTDIFIHPEKYAFGCFAASKIIMIQGALDYFERVKGDTEAAQLIIDRLQVDGEPLLNVEPGRMWYFENGIDEAELKRPGKILDLLTGVAPYNFVPGDWSYFLNTDPVSHQRLGYEGSNTIYLGSGIFDDFFNDNNHHYLYHEKITEVYQWKQGVFNRVRDYDKLAPVSSELLDQLSQSPRNGGFVLRYRAVPYFYKFADLP